MISRILNHISKRNYHKINRRVDSFINSFSKNQFDMFGKGFNELEDKVSRHLSCMESVDLRDLLTMRDKILLMESSIKALWDLKENKTR